MKKITRRSKVRLKKKEKKKEMIESIKRELNVDLNIREAVRMCSGFVRFDLVGEIKIEGTVGQKQESEIDSSRKLNVKQKCIVISHYRGAEVYNGAVIRVQA